MGIRKYYSGFWVGFTIILSMIFSILFFPAIRGNYSFMQSILLTAAGVILIWVVYIVRAMIYIRIFGNGKDDNDKDKAA